MICFFNQPDHFADETLDALWHAYPDFYFPAPAGVHATALRQYESSHCVSIITGGGSGHMPLFVGYVGQGLCAGAAIGDVFSSPSAQSIAWVVEHVPHQRGVVFILGNYVGDIINFQMAARLAEEQGIDTRMVVVSDDLATASRQEWTSRRCIGGIAFVYKTAGAASKRGMCLDDIVKIAHKTNQRMASIGVAFSSCQLPNVDTPVFSIGSNEMEIGMGIHGEQGVRRVKMMRSKEIAEMMVDKISTDLSLQKGTRVCVLVNGLGATLMEELLILFRDVQKALENRCITIYRKYIGNYATALDTKGASVSILEADDEIISLLDEPVYSPLLRF